VSDVIAGLLEESTAGCVSSSMSRVMGNGCGATKNAVLSHAFEKVYIEYI